MVIYTTILPLSFPMMHCLGRCWWREAVCSREALGHCPSKPCLQAALFLLWPIYFQSLSNLLWAQDLKPPTGACMSTLGPGDRLERTREKEVLGAYSLCSLLKGRLQIDSSSDIHLVLILDPIRSAVPQSHPFRLKGENRAPSLWAIVHRAAIP